MILGQFSPYIFFRTCSIVVGAVILIIYWISQYKGHEPPFPNCWISGVAQHYPQFVFFRIGTISGSVLMAMGWFTNHFYIKTICRQHAFNIRKYHPEIILVSGLMASFALMGSTAYIDTGKMDGPDHQHCAAIFFGCVLFAQVMNTILFLQLMGYNMVNKTLAWLKLAQMILIAIQGAISALYGVEGVSMFGQTDHAVGTVIGKILEWSMTYTVLFGFLIMSYDVQNFAFLYQYVSDKKQQKEPSNQEIREVQQRYIEQ